MNEIRDVHPLCVALSFRAQHTKKLTVFCSMFQLQTAAKLLRNYEYEYLYFTSNLLATTNKKEKVTNLTTYTHPFHGSLNFVRDYPDESVPESIWIY